MYSQFYACQAKTEVFGYVWDCYSTVSIEGGLGVCLGLYSTVGMEGRLYVRLPSPPSSGAGPPSKLEGGLRLPKFRIEGRLQVRRLSDHRHTLYMEQDRKLDYRPFSGFRKTEVFGFICFKFSIKKA